MPLADLEARPLYLERTDDGEVYVRSPWYEVTLIACHLVDHPPMEIHVHLPYLTLRFVNGQATYQILGRTRDGSAFICRLVKGHYA